MAKEIKEAPATPPAKEPTYLMRHPRTGHTVGVDTQDELIPLMYRGYQQVKQ